MTPSKKSITLSLKGLDKSEIADLKARLSKDPEWNFKPEPLPKVNPNRASSPNYTTFEVVTTLEKARRNRVHNG